MTIKITVHFGEKEEPKGGGGRGAAEMGWEGRGREEESNRRRRPLNSRTALPLGQTG